MITQAQYDLLKAEFGTVSSWAVWAPPKDTVKSGTGDLSMFSNDGIIKLLNPNYVFVGLNASSTHIQQDGVAPIRVWGNFHSTDSRRQNDFNFVMR